MKQFLALMVVCGFCALYADDDVCPMDAPAASCEQKAPASTKDAVAKEKTTKEVSHAETYVCSTHVRYTAEKPGKCPRCGKELVKKEKKAGKK